MNRLSSVHRGFAAPTRSPSDTVSLCRTPEIRFHCVLSFPIYPQRLFPGNACNNRITTLFSGISGISDSLVSGISALYVGCVRCVSHVRFVRLVRHVWYRRCSTGTRTPVLPAFSVTFLSLLSYQAGPPDPISPIYLVFLTCLRKEKRDLDLKSLLCDFSDICCVRSGFCQACVQES